MTLEGLLLVLAILGGIDIAWRGVSLLSSAFPPLLALRARGWQLLADGLKVPALRRKAVSARIEEVTNQTAFQLQKYLPKSWIRRARIRWVRHSAVPYFHEGEIILLVRPNQSADQNLLHALWHYFRGALFPQSRDVLPDPTVAAIALAIVRASIEEYHPYLLADFDGTFTAAAAIDPDVRDQFSDFVRLNEVGLLMGPFLREVDHIARVTRFSDERSLVPQRIRSVTAHMLGFQPLLRINKPEEEWIYQDGDVSYGFLLVSRPADIRPGIDAYVRRAQKKIARGISRIYVIGRAEERDFVTDVIASLLTIRELRGVEIFSLFRDYRGDVQGVGALLGLDEFLARLQPSRRIGESASASVDGFGSLDDVVPAAPTPLLSDSSARRELADVVQRLMVTLSDYDGAWIPLAVLGSRLRAEIPEFDPVDYGGRNLAYVLQTLGILDFDARGAGPAKAVYVRLRTRESADGRLVGRTFVPPPHEVTATRAEQFHAAHPELAPLARQIHHVTGTPFLASTTYRKILEITADEVNRGGFQLNRVSKAVRDRCLQDGAVVDRASVNFVLTGLTYAGWRPEAGVTVDADSLARLLVKNTLNLARGARLQLTADEQKQIWRWIAGQSETPTP